MQGSSDDDPTVGYTLFDAKASYRFGKWNRFTVFAKGQNLTGATYEIRKGFPMPGANLLCGIEAKF